MSTQDPLSEARELLRDIRDGEHPWRWEARYEAVLARLDALPAPERIDNPYGSRPAGWFYPDAPVARDDGGDDA